MNAAGVEDSLEQLGDCLGDLQKNLQPLLTGPLSETTKKLPLLDRAQLYITVVYAIESLLFSYLRLQGVDAKEHNIMKEIKRVQQYFNKVKIAEESGMKRDMTLDKAAAGRFIKHALAGNQKHDLEYAERKAKELFLAKKKLQELEERKRQRDLQAANSSPATPAANGSTAQSPEIDTAMMVDTVAQIKEEADAAAAAVDVDAQTPDSPAPSESSTRSARSGKKRRPQEAQADTPSGKKKKKRKYAPAAAAAAAGVEGDS